MSCSANALKTIVGFYDSHTSFETMHTIAGRAIPNDFMLYRHSLLLHKTYNDVKMGKDWVVLNHNQVFRQRNTAFQVVQTNRYKIGRNKLSDRFKILDNKLELESLNFNQFKIKMKQKFILKL